MLAGLKYAKMSKSRNMKTQSPKYQRNKVHIKLILAFIILLIKFKNFQNHSENHVAEFQVPFSKVSIYIYLANHKRLSTLSLNYERKNSTVPLLLIILSNDINLNPGPKTKSITKTNMCTICDRKIKPDEPNVKCQTCLHLYHLNCTNINENCVWVCSSKNCKPNYTNMNEISMVINQNPFSLQGNDELNFQVPNIVPTLSDPLPTEEEENVLNLFKELPKISHDDYQGKDLCRKCFKEVRPHHQAISCDSCETWIHRKCSDMSQAKYNQNKFKNWFPWICNVCRKDDTLIDAKIDPSNLKEADQPSKVSDMKESNDFKILNINCRSILNKAEELFYILKELNPDIVCLTETWLDQSTPQNSFIPNGYSMIRKDRTEAFKQRYGRNHGGGVAVIHKQHLKIELKSHLTNKTEEILWVEVKGKQNFLLSVVYRPDYCDILFDDENESILEESVRKATEITNRVIITGDFNIDMSNPTHNQTEKLTDILTCYGLQQHVNKPTRINNSGKATIIDHIWSNKDTNLIKNVDTFIALSDHLGTFASLNLPQTKTEEKIVKRRCWKKYSRETFNEKLLENIEQSKLKHHIEKEEVNPAMTELSNIIKSTMDEIAPIKEIKISQQAINIPWYTQELHDMITCKKELLSDYYSTKMESLKNSVKNISNKIGHLKRKLKQNYITEKISEAGTDSKQLWKIINLITNRKTSRKTIEPDFINQEKANTFNNHFATVGQKIQEELAFQPPATDIPKNNLGFEFQQEKEETISKLIDFIKIDVAIGEDGIPAKILKDGKTTIAPYLTQIVNLSYKLNIFPDSMKVAVIKPLHKKEDINIIGNYRPISLLPILSKIFEKSATNQLIKYLEENNLLASNQHAYRKGHSTTTCLAEVLNRVHKLVDQKKNCAIVSLDLSKAFDSINHDLLLNKLLKLKLSGPSVLWIKSYLSNRHQKTKFEKHVSTSAEIKSGVPQGSIIGPLLFLIFTNDLPSVFTDKCNIISYADDTQLIIEAENLPTLIRKIEEVINIAQNWYSSNSMKNNTGKSEVLIINARKNLKHIKIKVKDGNKFIKINPKPFIEVLGVKIDDKLNWTKQISSVKKKAFNSIRCIHRINPMLPIKLRVLLYTTLVTPILDYADVVWGHCGEVQMNNLQKAQNFAIKSIVGKKKYDSTSEAFSKLKFLNLHQRQEIHEATFTLKSLLDVNPSHINVEYLKLHPINNNRNSRSSSERKLNLPQHQTSRFEQCPLYKTIKSWNSVPEHIPTHNIKVFKTNFQKFIIKNTYSEM